MMVLDHEINDFKLSDGPWLGVDNEGRWIAANQLN